MNPVEISDALGLQLIKDKNWTIWYLILEIKHSATNALTGEGLNGGLDWLVDQLEYLNKGN